MANTTTTTTPSADSATTTTATTTSTAAPCTTHEVDVSGLLPFASNTAGAVHSATSSAGCAVSIEIHVDAPAGACVAVHEVGTTTSASSETTTDASSETTTETAAVSGCLSFSTAVGGEAVAGEAAVFFTEALAKLDAREIREAEAAGQTLPCCACRAGWTIDTSAPLRDVVCLLEAGVGHPASVVAYAVGRLLARGLSCRVVLIDGERLAYQLADGEVVDPLSKYTNAEPGQECCCGQHCDG